VGSRSIGEEEWRLRKAASLIKLLALAPGHRLHREQAMELLWSGLDPVAAASSNPSPRLSPLPAICVFGASSSPYALMVPCGSMGLGRGLGSGFLVSPTVYVTASHATRFFDDAGLARATRDRRACCLTRTFPWRLV